MTEPREKSGSGNLPIGPQLRALRQSRGMSLSELARRSGVSKGYLSQIENETSRSPSLKIMQRLSRALELPVTALVSLTEQPEGPELRDGQDGQNGRDGGGQGEGDAQFTRGRFRAPHELPPGLRLFRLERPGISEEMIDLLFYIDTHSERRLTAAEYWFIYEALAAALNLGEDP